MIMALLLAVALSSAVACCVSCGVIVVCGVLLILLRRLLFWKILFCERYFSIDRSIDRSVGRSINMQKLDKLVLLVLTTDVQYLVPGSSY